MSSAHGFAGMKNIQDHNLRNKEKNDYRMENGKASQAALR